MPRKKVVGELKSNEIIDIKPERELPTCNVAITVIMFKVC